MKILESKKSSKKKIEQDIKELFSKNPSTSDIKRIKKIAMSKSIKLKNLRKKFCRKCLTYFDKNNREVRIRKPMKIIKCKNCGYVTRYKMK